ncbi:uncharacterized protein EpC_30500 [Erwinia pyrifoliae Ep1/96]|nr:hypothetical protein CPI84_03085 [Erwinia pyrifoliae]CAX56829.1 uncharacterized protein EpC_30500 [Erwinia pyrifoliae Ep1/96]
MIFPPALLSTDGPTYPSWIYRYSLSGSGAMLIEYKPGSFRAKLGAKIASVTSGHNVTCFDCEAMISPLFRWPNSVCYYR